MVHASTQLLSLPIGLSLPHTLSIIKFCFLLTGTNFKPKTPVNGKNDQIEVKISFLTESVVHVSTQLLSLPIVLTHCLFSALVVIGATAGSVVLILTISVLTTIICIVLSNRRKNRGLTPTVCVCVYYTLHFLIAADVPTDVRDLRVSNVSHSLTPNPIYGGPLYETIGNPLSLPLTIKPEPPSPCTLTPEPKYTDSPTTGQAKLPACEYEEAAPCKRETEDCYIQMHTNSNRQ